MSNFPFFQPFNPDVVGRTNVGFGPYSYVLDNPLRYEDPTGHFGVTYYAWGEMDIHLTSGEAQALWSYLTLEIITSTGALMAFTQALMAGSKEAMDILLEKGFTYEKIQFLSIFFKAMVAAGADLAEMLGALTAAAWLVSAVDNTYGNRGVDIVTYGPIVYVAPPNVSHQHGVWFHNKQICGEFSISCLTDAVRRLADAVNG